MNVDYIVFNKFYKSRYNNYKCYPGVKYKLKKEGSLCDVVPTITDVYEISRPNEMTGESLIIKNE